MFGNSNYSVGDYGNFRLHFLRFKNSHFLHDFESSLCRSITILYPFVCLWLFHCDYSFWGNALAILSSSFLQYCENVFDGRIFLVHTYARVARYLVMSALTHLFLDSTVYVYICIYVYRLWNLNMSRLKCVIILKKNRFWLFFFVSFFKARI